MKQQITNILNEYIEGEDNDLIAIEILQIVLQKIRKDIPFGTSGAQIDDYLRSLENELA